MSATEHSAQASDGMARVLERHPPETSTACPEYPANVESLVGVLGEQLHSMPERVVCYSIARRRTGIVTEPLTVQALVERSGRAAAVLRDAGVGDGDRVILSLSDPHEFIVAFFGSLLAGATAVPLPTVVESGAPRSFAARVRAVCGDCAPSMAVVENADRFHRVVGDLRLASCTPRDLAAPSGRGLELRDRTAAEPAFIQYTSGSTGTPKGVVVTHGNILANCKAIRDATGYSRADRMVAWLPLHHDMGLVGGLLTSIYCAAETCLMPPLAFLGRPVTWLEAITHCAATLTVAPTFAYSLCARKIPDKQLAGVDLSSLRLAYVGAEPIDPVTLQAFIERFTPYGLPETAMYPVYGLAEATLAVSFPAPGTCLRYDTVDRRKLATDGAAVAATSDNTDRVTFVSVGHPLPRHRVTIVDRNTGEPLGERQVGELAVEGDSVTPRYFSDAPGTVCRALHTGDLAYVADGHLYVVDRIKDLVIIGGQNYAPSDIENAVAQVDGLRRGRIVAFSAPRSEGGEALHIVAEASPLGWRPPKELEVDVRKTIRQVIALSVATVTIVAPGSLERTSSGKIKRRSCQEAHRVGGLEEMRSRSDVLVHRFARRVNAVLFGARRALRAVFGR
jgi:acyl-CoA synthetase (AMP-forming)/AMP-acid ligase II